MSRKFVLISVYIALQFLFIMWASQIVCSEPIDNNDLILDIESPEEIVETNIFTVTILANETPVEDVIVIFIDNIRLYRKEYYIERTDSYGKVQFTAPSLTQGTIDRTYTLFAMKVGFIANEKNITIKNIPNLQIKEEIKTKYNHDEIVTITVIDYSSKPVVNATIEFEDNLYYSDDNGKVSLTMPSYNGKYELKIVKEGYANVVYDIYINELYQDFSPMIGFIFILLLFIALIIFLIIIFAITLKKKFKKK